jgi:selenide,water dikinase
MDDAAVVRPPSGPGLVMTIDVIAPNVDDPFAFGAIAAANALSDVWAMGGEPQLALTFAGFPNDVLPLSVLERMLAGVHDACARARCAIVGGHTISDPEPKLGLAVVGSVDAAHAWTHGRARAGDVLVLTKPIGAGVLSQAIKAGTAGPAEIDEVTARMCELNDVARQVGMATGVAAATDVTGFGLLGHLKHLVEASDLGADVDAAAVPLFSGARARADAGQVPGGTRRNLAYAAPVTIFDDGVPDGLRLLLADAQTSGGLLLCVPAAHAAEALQRLADGGCRAARVGSLRAAEPGAARILVR